MMWHEAVLQAFTSVRTPKVLDGPGMGSEKGPPCAFQGVKD